MKNFLAFENLEKFYADHPDSLVFALVASRYLEQGNLNKALEIAENGIRKYPNYPFGHFIIGLCYYYSKDFTRAKSHLELATGFDEKNPRAWKILGEINEKLGLPLLAEECFLKYYLLDRFNQDAVDKIQKEEVFQFEGFGEPEAETEREEKLTASGGEVEMESTEESPGEASKSELDELFKEEWEEPGKVESSEDVGEVFEEALGDASEREIEPEKEEGEEPDSTIDISDQEEEKPELVDLEGEKLEDAMDKFFIEFSEQETQESEGKKPGVSSEDELGALPFTEIGEMAEREQPGPAEGEKTPGVETTPGEEFLDFSSVVEDIISDREEGTEPEEDTGERSATTMTVIREEETSEEKPSAISITVSPEQPSPKAEEEELTDSTARFGRPPILSPTLGEIYIAQGRFEEAIEVFRQLLAKDPENLRFQRKIRDLEVIIDKQKSRPEKD